jgi:protein-disulfide isomerase
MFKKQVLAAFAVATLSIACSPSDGQATAQSGDIKIDYVKGDVVLGNPDAKVQILEYASTACGHCRTFHKTILPNIKRDFIDTGKVNMMYRDLPTAPAPIAAAGAALARCAGEEKYYDVLDDVFTSQPEIFDAARAGAAIPAYQEIGSRHGMSAKFVEACVTSSKVMEEISRTSDLATKDQVNSTPTLFINGERVTTENMSVDGLTKLLNAALGIDVPSESSDAESSEDN